MEDQVKAALNTVASRHFPHGFHIDRDDQNEFLRILRWEPVTICHACRLPSHVTQYNNDTDKKIDIPRTAGGTRTNYRCGVRGNVQGKLPIPGGAKVDGNVEVSCSAEVKGDETKQGGVDPHTRLICEAGNYTCFYKMRTCVQADFVIRVYSLAPVKVGVGVGVGVGALGGAAGGVAGGAAVGAAIGIVVPVVGNIIGGIIGGVIGGVGGVVAGGAAGAGAGVGAGAGIGAGVSDVRHVKIKAKDVFSKLPHFEYDKKNNLVYCTLLENNIPSYDINTAVCMK